MLRDGGKFCLGFVVTRAHFRPLATLGCLAADEVIEMTRRHGRLDSCDRIDFDQGTQRQSGDLHTRPGREGLRKISRIDRIDSREIIHAREKHRRVAPDLPVRLHPSRPSCRWPGRAQPVPKSTAVRISSDSRSLCPCIINADFVPFNSCHLETKARSPSGQCLNFLNGQAGIVMTSNAS